MSNCQNLTLFIQFPFPYSLVLFLQLVLYLYPTCIVTWSFLLAGQNYQSLRFRYKHKKGSLTSRVITKTAPIILRMSGIRSKELLVLFGSVTYKRCECFGSPKRHYLAMSFPPARASVTCIYNAHTYTRTLENRAKVRLLFELCKYFLLFFPFVPKTGRYGQKNHTPSSARGVPKVLYFTALSVNNIIQKCLKRPILNKILCKNLHV